jgi:D-alanyl-D-alanine dipeptidase
MRTRVAISLILIFTMLGVAHAADANRSPLPDGFVYVDQVVPGLVVDLRYYGSDNFVGAPVDGYRHPFPILTKEAAAALAGAQKDLNELGLGLKVFDAYRPQRAVDHFVRWAKDLTDLKTKAKHYPDVAKKDLFKEGYIAGKSSHSRGSTVDITIFYRGASGTAHELDMGSPYDFFGPISWPTSMAVTGQQRANRMLLRSVMVAHGFASYAQEWWHFTLTGEPYPNTYFNFPL